jgi:hypothetical protein
VRNLDREALLAYARHKEIPRVIIVKDGALEELDLSDGRDG